MSKAIDIPVESAIRMLLNQIAARFEEGDAMFLSSDFQRALRQVRDERFNVLDNDGPGIQLERLHRSNRCKSGFVGVYANGKGFRAMAKTSLNSTGLRSIGTFQTAEEAAWRRYLYYMEHGLPYGELEVEMERWRSGEAGGGRYSGTDEELIEDIRKHAQIVGTEEEIFGLNRGNKMLNSKLTPSTASPYAVLPKPDLGKVEPMVAAGFDLETTNKIFGDEDSDA